MKRYINTETMQYPLTSNQIKNKHKNTSFAKKFVPPSQYAEVIPTSKIENPFYLKKVVEAKPEKIEDKYYQTWKLVDMVDDTDETETKTQKIQRFFGYRKAEVRNKIAAERYNTEVAGILYKGSLIATDRESQNKISAVYTKAFTNPHLPDISWKTSSGFIRVTRDEFLILADSVFNHIQACFDIEENLITSLDEAVLNEEDPEASFKEIDINIKSKFSHLLPYT